MPKRATAAVTVQRPPAPITTTALNEALRPVLELLGIESADDLSSLTVTPSRVRVNVIPRHRGHRQHDALLRVSYPVVFDGEQ